MIDKLEIDALMESTAEVVREYVAAELGKMASAITAQVMQDVERRIKEIPAGPQGQPGEPGLSIKGDPGKDADPELIRTMIESEVIRAVGALPPPKDGPAGKDGKDAALVDTAAIVADVLARIPIPKEGAPGKDASIEQVKGFVLDEVARAVSELPKPKDGEPGKDGQSVHPDTIALMVVNEVTRQIAAVPKAKDGRDGDPGRDALQIEILPAIDPAKSYPRGTHAEYRGGTIRATRSTDPITSTIQEAGWAVVCDGEWDFYMVLGADLRTFTFKKILTSGRTFESSFQMPVVIQRGIFKDGTEYAQGDQVVYDNSTWTCMIESTKARPGISKDWLLSARKGDKGKDGQSITGPQGPPGRDGKDLTQMDGNGRKW